MVMTILRTLLCVTELPSASQILRRAIEVFLRSERPKDRKAGPRTIGPTGLRQASPRLSGDRAAAGPRVSALSAKDDSG